MLLLIVTSSNVAVVPVTLPTKVVVPSTVKSPVAFVLFLKTICPVPFARNSKSLFAMV